MQPILTAAEMAEVDRHALEHVAIEQLVERAGTAIVGAALAMLGGAYGRRVLVVAGRGHNGDDGRLAAKLLARRGAMVRVVEVGSLSSVADSVDLVIDAAYGTGFHGEYVAPSVPASTSVLAVDLPSGLGADDGAAGEGAVRADVTVTFGAYKPGLFLGRGPELTGSLRLEPIGLEPGTSSIHLVEDADLAAIPARQRDTNKWRSALFVLAGSPEVRGAPDLAALGALRSGAGMLRMGSPGVRPGSSRLKEAVTLSLEAEGFAPTVAAELERCHALVAGPGLGTGEAIRRGLLELLASSQLPTVLDADALSVLAADPDAARVLASRSVPAVLTPHDGEFARLAGGPPGPDRIGAARSLAKRLSSVVLLKGSTTVIAAPSGEVLLVTSGSPRLATAGSGDVLSGVIGALLASGLAPLVAAGIGAHLHGRAAARGHRVGLVAGDLPALIAEVLSAQDVWR